MIKARHWLVAAVLSLSTVAQAEVSESEFAEMKAGLVSLMERVNALEAENKALRVQSVKHSEAVEVMASADQKVKSNWSNTVKVKGDLRYRYEGIAQDGRADRERKRVRARAAVVAKLKDNVEVGIGIASGNDDPVSTNQSLGGGGATKDTRLDLAYFKWRATENVAITGGKFKNVFYKPHGSELIFDGDYNPEGVAFGWNNGSGFLTAALYWLESDTRRSNHRFSYGVQGGYNAELGGGKLTAGLGYYQFGTQGRSTFYGDEDDFAGNTFTCADPVAVTGCLYDNDFTEIQVFGDWSTTIQDRPFSLYAEYLNNTAADRFDTAWSGGFKYGKASARGKWEFDYRYEDREADSVFGLITGSDFGGGGTDANGHILKGAIAMNKAWKFSLTYFMNETNQALGTEAEYDRIQIDSAFKF